MSEGHPLNGMAAAAAALLFAWGCLLVRPTLLDVSPCLTTPSPPALDRLVVVVVDGLRWPDAARAFGKLAPPGSAWIRLVAHPPTATLPSVRSMLTGGLPAFIDAGSGVVFGSQAVAEDTWVGRLRACGGGGRRRPRVVAFGDAAWGALLGGQAGLDAGSWSTPALDVSSADDSRVWASLQTEVEGWRATGPAGAQPTPSVAVAHVNALDHAQHAHGPGSPTAEAALAAIRGNLTSLVTHSLASPAACVSAAAAAPGDTLLLVLGDHGATRDGNHGGASADETDTALLAVSVRAVCAGTSSLSGLPPRAVHTTDLAPALALLLGVPPPFSSIGRLPEGLWRLVHGGETYPAAVRANAAQVGRYLRAAPWAGTRRRRQRPSAAVAHALSRLDAGDAAWDRNDTARAVWAWEAGLDAALAAARADHASFGLGRMGCGVVGMVAVAAWRGAAVVVCQPDASAAKLHHQPGWHAVAFVPLLLATAHAASLFSVGALQAEGWVVAGLTAALVVAGTRPTPRSTPVLAATVAATWTFLPRAARTAAEAMHLVGRTTQQQQRRHLPALPWALAAAQAWLVARSVAAPAAVVGVALTLSAHTAFHASGHFPEISGLRMDLTAGLPHGVAVAVVAVDTLAPFFAAGAAAAVAGRRVQAAAGAARAVTLAGAGLSAAVHARHILAPSVFAPRFVFELAFYVTAEVGGWCASKITMMKDVQKK